jgi:sialidase-1
MGTLGLALILCTTAAIQEPRRIEFVADGVPLAVRSVGPAWERGPGFLRGQGVGNLLRAGRDAGTGDLSIEAEISLEELAGTAASLVLGGHSHFGFDGRGRGLFVEGLLFGGAARALDPGGVELRPGIPFAVLVERRGTSLRLSLDGALVHEQVLPAGAALGSIALRPWRAAMRVRRFAAAGDLVEAPAPVADDALWQSGQGGYHTYRIPALGATPAGTLLAFCEGRKNGAGDSGDIDLLLRRSTDGGATWSAPQVIWDDGANTCGNPCPVVDAASGTVVLLSTWNDGRDHERQIIAGESRDTRRVFVLRSSDEGRSWSPPQEITADAKAEGWTWYATGPGNGIQLERGAHAGRLVVPCDHIEAGTGRYRSHCLLSDDGGRSWRRGAATPGDAVNECAVVELEDGSLLLNMRNYDRDQRTRQVARSVDGGASWRDQRHDPVLIEPICQASLIRARTGPDRPEVLLFANPASREGRVRMTVRLSADGGATWPSEVVLHAGPSAYSSLAAHPTAGLFCLFEGGEASPYEALVLRPVRLGAEPARR